MATYNSSKKAGFTGSFNDWVSAGRPAGAAPKAPEPKPQSNITPERKRQIEDAARSTSARARNLGRSQGVKQFKKTGSFVQNKAGVDKSKVEQALGGQQVDLNEQEKAELSAAKNRQRLLDEQRKMSIQSEEFRQQAKTGQARDTGFTRDGRFFTRPQQELGPEPVEPTPPKFTGEETPLDRERALNAYNQRRAEYFSELNDRNKEDLRGVSGQVSDFGVQLNQYASQIDSLIANLNSEKEGFGSDVQEALQSLQSNPNANINEGTLSELNALPTDLSTAQVQEAVTNIVTGGSVDAGPVPQPALEPGAEPMEVTPDSPMTPSDGGGEAEVMKKLEEANEASKQWNQFVPDGNIISSSSGTTLSVGADGMEQYTTATGAMVPRNSQTGLPDYQAMTPEQLSNISMFDVMGLDMAIANRNTDLQAIYTAETLKQQQSLAKVEEDNRLTQIESTFKTNEGRIQNASLKADEDAKLAEERLILEKDASVKNITDTFRKRNARMEAFLKANGLEGSPAAMKIMAANELQFTQAAAQVSSSYNNQIAQLASDSAAIQRGYALDLVENNNTKNTLTQNLRSEMMQTSIDISNSALLNAVEQQTQKANNYLSYVTKVKEAEAAQKAADAEAEQTARENMLDMELEFSKEMGFLVEIDEDGNVKPLLNEQGKTILTADANETYNKMKKSEIKVVDGKLVAVNPYTNSITELPTNDPYTNKPWSSTPDFEKQTFSVNGIELQVGDDWSTTELPWAASECVGFARFCGDNSMPGNLYTINDKRKVYGDFYDPSQLQAGDIVSFDGGDLVTNPNTQEEGKSGHMAYVTNINPDGTFDVIEANFEDDPDRAIIDVRRNLSISQIDQDPVTKKFGIVRGSNPPEFQFNDINRDKADYEAIDAAFSGFKLTSDARKSSEEQLERYKQNGDLQGAQEFLLTNIYNNANAETQKRIAGRAAGIDALERIRQDMIEYEANEGDNLGVLTGLKEKALQKYAGRTGDTGLAQLETQIAQAIIDYRRSVSGAAFTQDEADAYEALYPSIGKTKELNLTQIEQLIENFERSTDTFYELNIGKRNYEQLFGGGEVGEYFNPMEQDTGGNGTTPPTGVANGALPVTRNYPDLTSIRA